jgi:acyl-CoA synthetase (AMP-forming)/AMP-acid ligase II
MPGILTAAYQIWRNHPDSVALTFLLDGHPVDLTFQELMDRARLRAAGLAARGVSRGDVVMIMFRHRPELADSFWGAIWLGAIPSFMPPPSEKQDPGYFWMSHAELFRRTGVRLLITDLGEETGHGQRLREHGIPIWDVLSEPLQDAAAPPACDSEPGAIALLQHSSGTTSLKRGVALSHDSILAQVASYGPAIGLGPGRTVVSWLPLYHDMGLIACFLLPLLTGARTVMMCPFRWVREPWLLLDAIESYRGDFVWMPNFAFNLLAMTRPQGRLWQLGGVEAFIDCSEPCKPDTLERFAGAFADCGVRPEQLQVSYAMAETVFAVTQSPLHTRMVPLSADAAALAEQQIVKPATDGIAAMRLLPVGRPIPGMRARVMNERGEVQPEGAIGEIAVTGTSLFDGYYRLPEETSRSRRGEWHLTGDLGFFWQGDLYVTGRKTDVIIVRGKKFHAFDIEHVAADVPGVKPGRAVAFAIENREVASEDAVLVAECEQPNPALGADIKRAVFDRLGLVLFDVYLAPPRWIAKTTSGKISRHLNAEKYRKEMP